MACLDQNTYHDANKDKTDKISKPEKIANLRRKLPIVLDYKCWLKKSIYKK